MSTTCTSNGKDIKLHNNNSMWHTKMLSKPSSPMAEIYYRLFKSDVLPSVTKHGSNVEQIEYFCMLRKMSVPIKSNTKLSTFQHQKY